MADGQTTNRQFTKPEVGLSQNSWGSKLNVDFDQIDALFGSKTVISTTSGTTTLSATEENVGIIDVSGTLDGDATIVFSGRGGKWLMRNRTTGAFTVTAKVTGQTGSVLSQGLSAEVWCNSTDIISAVFSEAFPPGTLMLFQQTTAPTGWTKQTTHDDKGLRVVSGTASSGGSTAFSEVFGQSETGSHTLSQAETPAHTHTFGGTTGGISNFHTHNVTAVSGAGGSYGIVGGTAFGAGATSTESSNHTHDYSGSTSSIGSGDGHTHTVSLLLQYVDLIIAAKD